MRGAVFFDWDGTLTDGRDIPEPTPGTREAFRQLKENGYALFLATGRAKPYVTDGGLPFDGMICSNGSYAESGGRVVLDTPIPRDPLRRLLDRLKQLGIPCGIDHPRMCMTNAPEDPLFRRWLTTFGIPEAVFRPLETGEVPDGYKLSILYHSENEILLLRRELGGEFEFNLNSGYPCADTGARGTNKGLGLSALAGALGIAREQTVAFGDSENDLGMLRAAGIAVAMGRHSPALDPVCDRIAGTVEEDGVASELRKLGMIR